MTAQNQYPYARTWGCLAFGSIAFGAFSMWLDYIINGTAPKYVGSIVIVFGVAILGVQAWTRRKRD